MRFPAGRPAVTCELTQSVLHGYIDGELDAARAADFERHLISCPQCTSALEAQEALRSSIQQAALYERAPAALRSKLRDQFHPPAPVSAVPLKVGLHSSNWRWLGVAALFFLAAGLWWGAISRFWWNM